MDIGITKVYKFPEGKEFIWVSLQNNSIMNCRDVKFLENEQMIWLGGYYYIAKLSNKFGVVKFQQE